MNAFKAIAWSLGNRINNSIPFYPLKEDVKINQFVCNFESSWQETSIKASPSRRLSDLFWINLPWQKIRQELGTIHIVDVGCGAGTYGKKIQKWSNDRVESYTGIDITSHETWDEYSKEFGFQFFELPAGKFFQYIPNKVNFFISQSALEHIEEDLFFFEAVNTFLRETKNQAIQVHLIPSEQCINLYKYHGVRQYSIRTLENICRLFEDYSHCSIYTLGGVSCNRLHRIFISDPLSRGLGDLREIKTAEYDELLKQSIKSDFLSLEKSKPSFYALVIHSYPEKEIFL